MPSDKFALPILSQSFAILGAISLLCLLMWTPVLIAEILKTKELRTKGVAVIGKVVEHYRSRKENSCPFTANIKYEVNGYVHFLSLHGCGAGPELLGVGREVKVIYSPRRPSISVAQLPDASSDARPEWWVLGAVWAVPIVLFFFAWVIKKIAKIRAIGLEFGEPNSNHASESHFGFSYSWKDQKPIRILTLTTYVVQVVGMLAGLALAKNTDKMLGIWIGGAAASFPGFLLGLMFQAKYASERISENTVIVRRMGLVALLFSVVALWMMSSGFDAETSNSTFTPGLPAASPLG